MVAKRIRTFIDNFLIEDKSKETLEVKNPKECWEWYNKAMDELQELERLAKIGKAATDAFDLFSMGTVDEEGKEYFLFLFVEDMMDWWKETYEG